MYFIGLDVHKKTISYCVKDAAGRVQQEGKIGSTRRELNGWIRPMPQPRTIAMEATIFTGWIYDHLLPHAEKVKVAHPLMLRAIAAAQKKNDRIDAGKIADGVRGDFLPECHMASREIRDRRRTLRYRNLVIVGKQASDDTVIDTYTLSPLAFHLDDVFCSLIILRSPVTLLCVRRNQQQGCRD